MSMQPVDPQAPKSTNPLITASNDTTQQSGRFSWPSRGAILRSVVTVSCLVIMACDDDPSGIFGGWNSE